MAIASIINYLNQKNKTYEEGLTLFKEFSKSQILISFFEKGKSEFNFKKLINELDKLKGLNIEPKPISIAPQNIIKFDPINFENAPIEIREIRDEKNRMYAEAKDLFYKIKTIYGAETRIHAGIKLLSLMEGVNDRWEVIDSWKETGQIIRKQQEKAEIKISELSVSELLKELRNLPPNISKYKKKVAGSESESDRMKYSLALKNLQDKLDMVKQKLIEHGII